MSTSQTRRLLRTKDGATKRREEALAKIKTQMAFYNTFISPFEKQPRLLCPTNFNPSTSTSTKCHLLSLPAELRNNIYSYVLSRPEPIFLSKRSMRTYSQPSLLLVSKQIRREALPVYYSTNAFIIRFYLHQLGHLIPWLRKTTKQFRTTTFRTIRFEVQGGGWAQACDLLPLYNLIRRGKLAYSEEMFFAVKDRQGLDGLMPALNEVTRVAMEIGRKGRSSGKLVRCMERVYEEHIRAASVAHRGRRLRWLKVDCAALRAQVNTGYRNKTTARRSGK